MAAGSRQPANMVSGMASVAAPSSLLLRGLVVIIVILFALSFHRAFVANINWDEFNFLSFVHLYRNGTLELPLQSFHVHLFAWLPLVSDNEIHQIFAARMALWLLSVATGVLIYNIARMFCSREGALFSVVFYFGFSYVVDHGLSFRYDPICAFLFLVSLYFLLAADKSRYYLPLSAVSMAVAMMVSIKSAFYLGTIGTVFLAHFLFAQRRSAVVKNGLVFAGVFAGSFVLLYQLHIHALGDENLDDASQILASTGTKVLLSGQFLPRINYFLNALSQNGPIWVFMIVGLARAGHDLIAGVERKRSLLLMSFAVPLVTLLFYRNAYPYFYVFLMPAAVILGGSFADVLIARGRASRSKVVGLVVAGTLLMITGSVVGDYVRKLPNQTVAQAEIVTLVHRMFPDPVYYIDRNSMISSFPKTGFYMSTWGMESYLVRNRPIMEGLIRRDQPKFMIANSCALDILGRQTNEQKFCQYRLMKEDLEVLQANFVHHWGAVYVAGKAFEQLKPSEAESFEILIPGTYTVEANAAVTIDGAVYRSGDQVRLNQGSHTIAALDATADAVLRFGTNLPRPDHQPSSQSIYVQL